jgi:hypothetical protein
VYIRWCDGIVGPDALGEMEQPGAGQVTVADEVPA